MPTAPPRRRLLGAIARFHDQRGILALLVIMMKTMCHYLPSEDLDATIPAHTLAGLKRFLQGYEPGDFLEAVLSNNLSEACAHADQINRHFIFEIVEWLVVNAPIHSWGSPEKVRLWLEAKRGYLDGDLRVAP